MHEDEGRDNLEIALNDAILQLERILKIEKLYQECVRIENVYEDWILLQFAQIVLIWECVDPDDHTQEFYGKLLHLHTELASLIEMEQ